MKDLATRRPISRIVQAVRRDDAERALGVPAQVLVVRAALLRLGVAAAERYQPSRREAV